MTIHSHQDNRPVDGGRITKFEFRFAVNADRVFGLEALPLVSMAQTNRNPAKQVSPLCLYLCVYSTSLEANLKGEGAYLPARKRGGFPRRFR